MNTKEEISELEEEEGGEEKEWGKVGARLPSRPQQHGNRSVAASKDQVTKLCQFYGPSNLQPTTSNRRFYDPSAESALVTRQQMLPLGQVNERWCQKPHRSPPRVVNSPSNTYSLTH